LREITCLTHTGSCVRCASTFCPDHYLECQTCGEAVCNEHSEQCTADGDHHCHEHLSLCSLCSADSETVQPRCPDHIESCLVDGELVCTDHTIVDPITEDAVCINHLRECSTCHQEVSETMVTDGECQTCRGLSTKEERTAGITDEIPDSVDFPTLDINSNSQYIIVHGKRLLGSNEIIVIKKR